MSEYQFLWEYIQKSNETSTGLTCDEIEKIASLKIEYSFINAKK